MSGLPSAGGRKGWDSPSRRGLVLSGGRGRLVRTAPLYPGQALGDFDPAASLRAAALRQGGFAPTRRGKLCKEDLRRRVRSLPWRQTILFVVDASDSMAGGSTARIAAAKGAVLGLLQGANRFRDRVGLITFRDREAALLLAPTSSLELARLRLERIPVGGSTPLAAGLTKAWETARSLRAREPATEVLIVLLTDGEANVPLVPGGRIGPELERLAARFHRDALRSVVIHCGDGKAEASRELAAAMGAGYRLLEKVRGRGLRRILETCGGPP